MRLFSTQLSRLLYLIGILILAGYPVVAQDATGRIAGTVTDPSGAIVPGATVIVKNTGTGIIRQTTTDKQGYYQVLELPIGRYSVAAEATGFLAQDGGRPESAGDQPDACASTWCWKWAR
jgi:hypothetical protein